MRVQVVIMDMEDREITSFDVTHGIVGDGSLPIDSASGTEGIISIIKDSLCREDDGERPQWVLD